MMKNQTWFDVRHEGTQFPALLFLAEHVPAGLLVRRRGRRSAAPSSCRNSRNSTMLARSAGVHCSMAFGVIATIVLPATSIPMPPPMNAESASVKTA